MGPMLSDPIDPLVQQRQSDSCHFWSLLLSVKMEGKVCWRKMRTRSHMAIGRQKTHQAWAQSENFTGNMSSVGTLVTCKEETQLPPRGLISEWPEQGHSLLWDTISLPCWYMYKWQCQGSPKKAKLSVKRIIWDVSAGVSPWKLPPWLTFHKLNWDTPAI